LHFTCAVFIAQSRSILLGVFLPRTCSLSLSL